jgi:hypothetical protein
MVGALQTPVKTQDCILDDAVGFDLLDRIMDYSRKSPQLFRTPFAYVGCAPAFIPLTAKTASTATAANIVIHKMALWRSDQGRSSGRPA